MGFSIDKKKFRLRVSAGTYFIKTDNNLLYQNTTTNLEKKYVIPEGTIYANYRMSKTKSFYLFYDRQLWAPSANQVLLFKDLSNPLNINVGNPDLDASKSHVANLGFQNYDFASRSGYSLTFNGRYYDSQIISTVDYDKNTGVQTTSYTNISGTYETGLNSNWNKSIKKGAHTFGINLELGANYTFNQGYRDAKLYAIKLLSLSPSVGFSYEYGELLVVKPSYNFNSNNSKATDFKINSSSNKQHNFNVEMTSYWPKKWIFGNDFGYTYNSNISDGFKKDFYLWNTSLTYKLYKDEIALKIKVYDVLNQNQSAIRTITPTSVIDAENTVLKRYAMFSLSYKFQNFAKKK